MRTIASYNVLLHCNEGLIKIF